MALQDCTSLNMSLKASLDKIFLLCPNNNNNNKKKKKKKNAEDSMTCFSQVKMRSTLDFEKLSFWLIGKMCDLWLSYFQQIWPRLSQFWLGLKSAVTKAWVQ